MPLMSDSFVLAEYHACFSGFVGCWLAGLFIGLFLVVVAWFVKFLRIVSLLAKEELEGQDSHLEQITTALWMRDDSFQLEKDSRAERGHPDHRSNHDAREHFVAKIGNS